MTASEVADRVEFFDVLSAEKRTDIMIVLFIVFVVFLITLFIVLLLTRIVPFCYIVQ